jgi:uncharacterized membrane protein
MLRKWWSALPTRSRRKLTAIAAFDVAGLAYFLTQRDYGFVALTGGVLIVLLLATVIGTSLTRQ